MNLKGESYEETNSRGTAGSILCNGIDGGVEIKQPQPGEVKGYDKGEEYLSIWVHSIEDTEEGQCYRKSVDAFNKKYDGKYFCRY